MKWVWLITTNRISYFDDIISDVTYDIITDDIISAVINSYISIITDDITDLSHLTQVTGPQPHLLHVCTFSLNMHYLVSISDL